MESIILASHSPRRKEILEKVNIPYIAFGVEVDETFPSGRNVRSAVIDNASRKARAALEHFRAGLVLGVDTIVCFRGRVLGKPRDCEEARRFLRMLNGNRHHVYSGVTLRDVESGKGYSSCSVTEVCFERMSEAEIEHYLALGEWVGKAGGYAVQGGAALFVRRIEGSFYNVMGLPVDELHRLLKRFDYYRSGGRYRPVMRD